jgi:hypothetical protein
MAINLFVCVCVFEFYVEMEFQLNALIDIRISRDDIRFACRILWEIFLKKFLNKYAANTRLCIRIKISSFTQFSLPLSLQTCHIHTIYVSLIMQSFTTALWKYFHLKQFCSLSATKNWIKDWVVEMEKENYNYFA